MTVTATPFLMFQGGKAEEALQFYVTTIPDSRIVSLQQFGPDGPGPEGTVLRADAMVGGQRVLAHDSFMNHGFDFTPSFSFFLDCEDEAEMDRLYEALAMGGQVLMPPGSYGWSRKFAWISDRFGVAWQLNVQ